ncbi:MAG: helix-turn-helix domain-containing protein, partial [Gammaproteobacteria bacterium]|nr:helix-turn-helix transcriptional regulator [Gemmatimonadota bacterium]NIU76262.1 helix-turn-helix domain-containing protein [Gammaproteobacteria bacterium]
MRELARRVGAHPVSVSRAYRREYGVTITEYRRRVRVRQAAARIGDSGLSLSRIAHRTGHADHPHLCREFRRLTGL